jgi:hypothetical protein
MKTGSGSFTMNSSGTIRDNPDCLLLDTHPPWSLIGVFFCKFTAELKNNNPVTMKTTKSITLVLIYSSLFMIFSSCGKQATIPPPPETHRGDVVDTVHGVAIPDPYRWLEDQESPETRAWLDKQNEYTDSFLDGLPSKEYISNRYTELLRVDRVGIPSEAGSRYFFTKRAADQDLSVICMREGLDGEDRVLIDPHPMSEDNTISVSFEGTSRNGELMAYGIRKGGEDEVAVRIFDVDAGVDLPDSLPRARYFGISFLPDLSGFYYTRFGAEGSRVYFHETGTEIASDRMVFGEGYDPGLIIFAGVSEDGNYLVVHVLYGSSADKTDVFIRKLDGRKNFTTVVEDQLDGPELQGPVGQYCRPAEPSRNLGRGHTGRETCVAILRHSGRETDGTDPGKRGFESTAV